MPNYTNADLVADVQDQAYLRLMDLAPVIIASVSGPGGAVGDEALDRNARILRFVDMAQSGTLDFLPVIGRQDLHDQLVKQFQRDMGRSFQ